MHGKFLIQGVADAGWKKQMLNSALVIAEATGRNFLMLPKELFHAVDA